MKTGDLVINKSSESGMIGIVVGWNKLPSAPIVYWADGRCNWIINEFVKVLNENRRSR